METTQSHRQRSRHSDQEWTAAHATGAEGRILRVLTYNIHHGEGTDGRYNLGRIAEVIRGGLQAIPKGQYEAGEALALSYWKSMGLVILPQALKITIPSLVNTFIALFKDTSLVTIIGLFDLLAVGKAGLADPNWLGYSVEAYVFIAFIFWIFCFGMSRYSLFLEQKLHTGHKH